MMIMKVILAIILPPALVTTFYPTALHGPLSRSVFHKQTLNDNMLLPFSMPSVLSNATK